MKTMCSSYQLNKGTPLIKQLIEEDSGLRNFNAAITRYLTEEKRPQLFANLAVFIA